MTIHYKDFSKVNLCVGTIVDVKPFKEAVKPAYIVHVDFGKTMGVKKTSAQITDLYTEAALLGKQIIGVVNLPNKQIGPIQSEFLLTGFETHQGVVIATTDINTPDGLKLC